MEYGVQSLVQLKYYLWSDKIRRMKTFKAYQYMETQAKSVLTVPNLQLLFRSGSSNSGPTYIHTHTHTYVYMCVIAYYSYYLPTITIVLEISYSSPLFRNSFDMASNLGTQHCPKLGCVSHWQSAWLILGLRPAIERRLYFVTTSLIGWVQA